MTKLTLPEPSRAELRAEIKRIKAQVAAAYEVAAQICELYPAPHGYRIAAVIREDIPADALAALEAIKSEAFCRGQEEMRARAADCIPDGPDEWFKNLRPGHIKRAFSVARQRIRALPIKDTDT